MTDQSNGPEFDLTDAELEARPPMSSDEDRFWAKVRIGDGCWEWTDHLTANGYGECWAFKRNMRAHRASWQFAHGPIQGGQYVLHRCDNRICVRPSHLFLGTHQDNMDDKVAKGRQWFCPGASNPFSKLTESSVAEIRRLSASGVAGVEIAKRFGISNQTVSDVVLRRSWAHVGGGQ